MHEMQVFQHQQNDATQEDLQEGYHENWKRMRLTLNDEPSPQV